MLPFDENIIFNDFLEKDIAVYSKYKSKFKFKSFLTFKEDFTVVVSNENNFCNDVECSWFIENGVLFVKDGDTYRLVIDSASVINGKSFYIGNFFDKNGCNHDAIICQKKEANFKVCISTDANYYDYTVGKILKSLNRFGIAEDALIVVHDENSNKEYEIPEIYRELNVKVRKTKFGKYGLSALMQLDNSADYWLTLHDTCEVVQKLDAIDVGLYPDFVLLSDSFDIGIYNYDFINEYKPLIEMAESPLFVLKQMSNIWVEGEGPVSLRGISKSKDVYGHGNKRSVSLIADSIKKYSRIDQSNGNLP